MLPGAAYELARVPLTVQSAPVRAVSHHELSHVSCRRGAARVENLAAWALPTERSVRGRSCLWNTPRSMTQRCVTAQSRVFAQRCVTALNCVHRFGDGVVAALTSPALTSPAPSPTVLSSTVPTPTVLSHCRAHRSAVGGQLALGRRAIAYASHWPLAICLLLPAGDRRRVAVLLAPWHEGAQFRSDLRGARPRQ